MDNKLKKADRLFEQGVYARSLELTKRYQKVLKARFKRYNSNMLQLKGSVRRAKTEDTKDKIEGSIPRITNIVTPTAYTSAMDASALLEAQNNTTKHQKRVRKKKSKKPTKNSNNLILEEIKEEDAQLLQRVVHDFNKYALECVNTSRLEESQIMFSKLVKICTSYCKQFPKLTCLTYNNLSCLYKKTGCPKKGLRCLSKALDLAKKDAKQGEQSEYLPLTFINLSAIYSESQMHKKSLTYSQKAVDALTSLCGDWEDGDIEVEIQDEKSKEYFSLLAIAYFNVGSQYEFLGQYAESKLVFLKSIQVLKKFFGDGHPLIEENRKSLKKIDKRLKREKNSVSKTFSNLDSSVIHNRMSRLMEDRKSSKRSTNLAFGLKKRFFTNERKNKGSRRYFNKNGFCGASQRNIALNNQSINNEITKDMIQEADLDSAVKLDKKFDINMMDDEYKLNEIREGNAVNKSLSKEFSTSYNQQNAYSNKVKNRKSKRPQSAKLSIGNTSKMKIVKKLQDAYADKLASKNNDLSILDSTIRDSHYKDKMLEISTNIKSIYNPSPNKRRETAKSSINNSKIMNESSMMKNSFAMSNDVNKLLSNCSKIYNSKPRRERPSTANVNQRSAMQTDALRGEYQSIKSHILNGNRPEYTSLNKTSSNFFRKLSFKPYQPNQSRALGPKKVLRGSKRKRQRKNYSERIISQENREKQNKTSMSFTNVIIV
ncbi:unnamed protein product [Moneuplotes crassus]|uniref:Uncharacterized protein n=3 Tax=Euplotes crassus TaxID=5936 RepID=A0AAD1Y9I4_EUPCR|nr:unnamed protein product [Moneuplotes crassus]